MLSMNWELASNVSRSREVGGEPNPIHYEFKQEQLAEFKGLFVFHIKYKWIEIDADKTWQTFVASVEKSLG